MIKCAAEKVSYATPMKQAKFASMRLELEKIALTEKQRKIVRQTAGMSDNLLQYLRKRQESREKTASVLAVHGNSDTMSRYLPGGIF